MTNEQFKVNLKSIGGLLFGSHVIYENHFVDEGWNQLLWDLIKELLDSGWDRQVLQIKEKFGGLRFYVESGSHEIIHKYETLSYKICEKCGREGTQITRNGWIKTLCKPCMEIS